MTGFEISTLALALIVALVELPIAVFSFALNHRRQKRQATIEHMKGIRDKYTEIDYKFIDKFGPNPLNYSVLNEIEKDHTLWGEVSYLLGMLEHLAVGVHTGVFDLKVLNRMSGGYIISIFNRFSTYIDEKRKQNSLLYEELELLTHRLKQIR